jgi:hypothetical protein
VVHGCLAIRGCPWRPSTKTRLSNGNSLSVAEEAELDSLLTTDGNMRYQQNLAARKIALLVLTGPQNGHVQNYTLNA